MVIAATQALERWGPNLHLLAKPLVSAVLVVHCPNKVQQVPKDAQLGFHTPNWEDKQLELVLAHSQYP
eukprot:10477228-Alexandrium_andersonii.AAC.1